MSNIREAKIIPDTCVYQVRRVGTRTGRKVMDGLTAKGEINPLITSTRRRLLSFGEAETLADAL